MKKFLSFVGLLFILALIFLVIIESLIIFFSYRDRIATKGDKIALIQLEGVILNSESIINNLKKCSERQDIKGIVLRIESPGGSVAAVQEIYEQILVLRKKGKKIVASFGNVAASGGYYVALACEKIYANPGTLTGSIGVIINAVNFGELMQKWGIELKSIASGQYKSTGTIARKMTPEEEAILQEIVNDVHTQFVNAVKENRNIPEDVLNRLTDGRIFTGSQAYKVGLIDGLGSLEVAIQETAKLCGIKGKPRVIEFRERRFDSSKLFGKTFQFINDKFLLRYILNYLS